MFRSITIASLANHACQKGRFVDAVCDFKPRIPRLAHLPSAYPRVAPRRLLLHGCLSTRKPSSCEADRLTPHPAGPARRPRPPAPVPRPGLSSRERERMLMCAGAWGGPKGGAERRARPPPRAVSPREGRRPGVTARRAARRAGARGVTVQVMEASRIFESDCWRLSESVRTS